MKTILAAVDFSDVTPVVVSKAGELAKALGAEVVLVHVEAGDPAFVGFEAGPQTVRDSVASEIHHDHQELQKAQKLLARDGVKATSRLLQGILADKILALAGQVNADLIIVGTHGAGPLKSLLLGSVSEAIVREATCPVLLVKTNRHHAREGS